MSTTSQQPSLDLIGINEESLDFIEIKKKGVKTSPKENHVRRLIEKRKYLTKYLMLNYLKHLLLKNEYKNKVNPRNQHQKKKLKYPTYRK